MIVDCFVLLRSNRDGAGRLERDVLRAWTEQGIAVRRLIAGNHHAVSVDGGGDGGLNVVFGTVPTGHRRRQPVETVAADIAVGVQRDVLALRVGRVGAALVFLQIADPVAIGIASGARLTVRRRAGAAKELPPPSIGNPVAD